MTHWLAESGADLLFRMRNTPDPRDYLRRTRLLLVPSVWQESFGRVAAEAMMNGIPVIGSNRGALPEVIGDLSLLLELSAWVTPESNQLPTRNEVAPWVERIKQLWDNPDVDGDLSASLRRRAEAWLPERTVEAFETAIRPGTNPRDPKDPP